MVFVNNKGARHVGIGHGVRLMPGITPVDDKLWAKATANPGPALRALLEDKEGGLVVASKTEADAQAATTTTVGGQTMRDSTAGDNGQQPAGGGTAATSSADLGTMTVDEAKGIIGETFDKATLQAWKKADHRQGVKDAVDKQLGILKLEEKK